MCNNIKITEKIQNHQKEKQTTEGTDFEYDGHSQFLQVDNRESIVV